MRIDVTELPEQRIVGYMMALRAIPQLGEISAEISWRRLYIRTDATRARVDCMRVIGVPKANGVG